MHDDMPCRTVADVLAALSAVTFAENLNWNWRPDLSTELSGWLPEAR